MSYILYILNWISILNWIYLNVTTLYAFKTFISYFSIIFFIFKIDIFFINFFIFYFCSSNLCAQPTTGWLNHMHHLLSKHDQASQDPPYLRPHFTGRTLSKLFFISRGDKVRICFLQWWSK